MRKTLEVRTRARRFKARELPRTEAGPVRTVGRGHPGPLHLRLATLWKTDGEVSATPWLIFLEGTRR